MAFALSKLGVRFSHEGDITEIELSGDVHPGNNLLLEDFFNLLLEDGVSALLLE